jgi:hypothetical protein
LVISGGSFAGVKRPGGGADSSPPSSAEVKNAWSYTSTPQYAFMAWCLVKAQGQLYLFTKVMESREVRWVGHVAFMREMIKASIVMIGESEGKRPLGRPRSRWEDIIRMYLKEIQWEIVDCIQVLINCKGF